MFRFAFLAVHIAAISMVAAADDNKSATAKGNRAKPKRTIVRPWVVVAKHVILLEGKIVTWDELPKQLRARSKTVDVRPVIYVTRESGFALTKNWRQLPKKVGVRISAIGMVRDHTAFDAIAGPKDLKPDPKHRKRGRVRRPNGKPADGATILWRSPATRNTNNRLVIENGRVQSSPNEFFNLARSDAGGDFNAYPKQKSFLLLAFHDSGFAVATDAEFAKNSTIRLQRWATLRGRIDRIDLDDEIDDKQGLWLESTLDVDPDWGRFRIVDSVRQFSKTGQFRRDRLPAGEWVIKRTVRAENGRSTSFEAKRVTIKPGATATARIGRPTKAEQKRIDEFRKANRRR